MSTKQVFQRKTNPETGNVEIVKVNKDQVNQKSNVPAPTNLKEMEQQLENNRPKEQTSIDNNNNVQESTATIGNQDAAVVLNPPPQKKREKSELEKQIDSMMAEISNARFKAMTDLFKEDIILLEYVKNGKVQEDRRTYVPMTMGMGKQINKIGKKLRLFREDLKGFGKSKGMDLDSLRKKYPDIIDEDADQDDIMDQTLINEMEMNFIIKQKCQIYWGINDTDPYPLSDLLVMIGLYESRNGFAPSSTN